MGNIDLSIPKGAIFSEDRKYRYVLWRLWSQSRKPLLVIGLNPSTANEIQDDPTITRCMKRASILGYGSLLMANLYAYVSTNPDVLHMKGNEFTGIENDAYLERTIALADRTVCGWGSFPAATTRSGIVLNMIKDPYCLGVNRDGQPKHPLYIGYHVPLTRYAWVKK